MFLVEDDESVREAVAHYLNVKGYGCAAYASAEALLARGDEHDAVCVVSDIRLPGQSGLQCWPNCAGAADGRLSS